MSAYAVSNVEPAGREDLFVRVRRGALGEGATSPELFRWQYHEAPDGPTEALVLECRSPSGLDPVGWAAVQERALFVDGRARRAGLLVNLVVADEHRKVLPALLLQRAARTMATERFELSFGYPNRAALGGFLRAGYEQLGEVRRHACILGSHAGKLAELGMSPFAAAAVGRAADAVSPLFRGALWGITGRRYRFEWPASVDRRFDRLWARASMARPWQIMSRRNAEFLRWRLLAHPEEPFAVAALVERASGEIAAYAALRQHQRRAHIADLFAADEETLAPLLDAVLEALVRLDVAVVDLCHFGHTRVAEILQLRGFRPREPVRSVIVDPGALGASLLDPERWHLTDVDGDL